MTAPDPCESNWHPKRRAMRPDLSALVAGTRWESDGFMDYPREHGGLMGGEWGKPATSRE